MREVKATGEHTIAELNADGSEAESFASHILAVGFGNASDTYATRLSFSAPVIDSRESMIRFHDELDVERTT
ncbi:hypothetical protein Tco_1014679, partial [Tanacetum coccineum]